MTNLFGSAALWPAEKFINHLLTTDSHIREQMAVFAGKCLEVRIHSPEITVTVIFESDRISLSASSAEILNIEPTASVSGDSGELINTVINRDNTPLANSKIEIAGDAQFVQELHKTVQALDIRWSDMFSPIAGDVVANEVDQFAEDLKTWRADTNKRLKRNVSNYMVEEARFVPHSSAVEKFSEDLDSLRFKIDRVKAKADLLYQRLEQLND